MKIAREAIYLTLMGAAAMAFGQDARLIRLPDVLYPNPFESLYSRTAQTATITDIGKEEILPGKTRVHVIFMADNHWMNVCSVAFDNYIRNLKKGERITIRPDEKSVRLKMEGRKRRLKLIEVSRWGNL